MIFRGSSLQNPPKIDVKSHSKKASQKLAEISILASIFASQNSPKIHPKCFPNRCFKKPAIFHGFLLIFGCLLQDPNLKFHAPTQCFVSVSLKSNVRFWHTSSVQKTFQKPFQNEVRTLPKSMPKTCCFLTSFFSGFGLDFGRSWTSMLEPNPPRCLQRQAC